MELKILIINTIMQKTIYELFDELDPKQKALFIDARIAWSSGSAICGEIRIRLCEPYGEIE